MTQVRVRLTQWSMGMREATVADVRVAVGDTVRVGDEILELEGEKVSDFIVAPAAGTVVAVHVARGNVVPVGSEMLVIEVSDR